MYYEKLRMVRRVHCVDRSEPDVLIVLGLWRMREGPVYSVHYIATDCNHVCNTPCHLLSVTLYLLSADDFANLCQPPGIEHILYTTLVENVARFI